MLGDRRVNEGLSISPTYFKLPHHAFAVNVQQEPHGDPVVIRIFCFDRDSVAYPGGSGIGHTKFDAAVVVMVLQRQAGGR